jgi:hypothetical protein
MPGLDCGNRVGVADHHGVDPLAQQPLGQFGVGLRGAEEIAERTEDGTAEPVTRGQQRRGAGGQPHAVPLEFFQRVPARGQLGQQFLCRTPGGTVQRFTPLGLRDFVAAALRRRGGAP